MDLIVAAIISSDLDHASQQHDADAFLLGWTAIVLEIDDVGGAKPTVATTP